MTAHAIELLAPAKNLACGMAAVNHGADAVYIGGPLFGARAAAANSLADIEKLTAYAHQFHARTYVALNTLLNDDELEQAVELCRQLHGMGVDALIIQDVGLLEADLPPIALHSSTQMNNRSPEKVRFLEHAGFSQVVLARELSLAQIRTIRAGTTVPLEFFVHGALCVSYSGQCYISEVMASRSANRGQCAQFCRHAFDLLDNNGVILEKNRYLLSLKDLDLSAQLEALIDAGIQSFKIEGRLKDENYVKNATAAYRLALDAIINARDDLKRASSGTCRFGFDPDPSRSFSRGATDYFLNKRRNLVAEPRTPKSIGKKIGRVAAVDARYFTVAGNEDVHNGDGLCFFNHRNELVGMRVNRVEGQKIFPKDGTAQLHLPVNAEIFRNSDASFNKILEQSQLCRTIAVQLTLRETADGLQLEVVDEDGIASVAAITANKEKAANAGTTAPVAMRQLKKSGGTVFTVTDVVPELSAALFVPSAVFNDLRRKAFAGHLEARLQAMVREVGKPGVDAYPWPYAEIDHTINVANQKAAEFYRRRGVEGLEAQNLRAGAQKNCVLMTTRHCIKAQLGMCAKMKMQRAAPAEPLTIADNTGTYVLGFDCNACEMTVRKKEPLS